MKLPAARFALVLLGFAIITGRDALAVKSEHRMQKVEYEAYSGPQQDWPHSKEPVQPHSIRHRMPIYDKLPDRPYEIIGTMVDEAEKAVKHVAQAAQVVAADALLVVDDPAFRKAGISIEPKLWEHKDIPDPNGPSETRHLDHPEQLKTSGQVPTIRVTRMEAILIRWKTK